MQLFFGFAVLTAFIPGVIGLTVNTSWAVMWLIAPLLLLSCKIEVTVIHILGLLFLLYATLSLLWSPHGFLELLQLFALASVFLWAYTLKDLKSVTIGLSAGLAVSSVVAILQYFKVDLAIVTVSKLTGLFINPNIYAEVSGMTLILILINRLYWCIPATVIGLIVTSRAVILSLGIALAMFVWHKSKLLAIGIVASSWMIILKLSDFTAGDTISSVSANTVSVFQRLHVWQDMLSGFTIFGNGVGSFVYIFPNYNKHLEPTDLAEYAHNDLLQLIFEFGIGSIPLILIVALLLKVNNEYRNALVFFIIVGFFGFPLHMPATGFMVALVAAQLAKSSFGSRTASDSIRSVLFNRMEAQGYR